MRVAWSAIYPGLSIVMATNFRQGALSRSFTKRASMEKGKVKSLGQHFEKIVF
jgi:hypothetical protein